MNVHITLVAYALDITPLVRSLAGPDVTWHIFRHSNKPEVIAQIDALLDDFDIDYHPYGVNRGLARSWSEGLVISQKMDADVMMLLNDDIVASRDDLGLLARTAVNAQDYGIVTVTGWNSPTRRMQSMNFGFTAVNSIAIEKVGYFDVNYWPIYGEDVDYSYRCGLSDITFLDAGPTGVRHLGNQTILVAPELAASNPITFAANEQYHATKWGGGYGKEVWRLPFNSENFDRKISADQIDKPYPGYNRTDQEIVRI